MKQINYLLRLDDACPTMDKKKWDTIEKILDKYKIKPMVGIIPNNKDVSLKYDQYDENFTKKIINWQKKGWTLALHGYDHCCCSNKDGINPFYNRSEFAGVDIEKQKEKIQDGIKYFKNNNITVNYFFAPCHTFDLNTIEALKNESNIRIISDTIAFNPYKKYGMIFIPQQFGRFRAINISGTWTFCYHPNVMDDYSISHFSDFIERYRYRFISFEEVDLNNIENLKVKDQLYQRMYFLFRKNIRNSIK